MTGIKNDRSREDGELQRAIEECRRVAAISSREAKKILSFINESINVATKDIEQSIKEISVQKMREPDILKNLTGQLSRIKTAFVNEHKEVELLVERKIKEANKFNITLFGRTKVGKSTLMEILTNGDGGSIGKGGQRTTLNVRQYEWRGMTITDVPGIDAFHGETDDRLAYEAAKTADIILFMISDGQPEATEAEWLVRLKREDKPIICLCNAKRTLDDELDMEMFLDNPSDILDDESIREIIDQFNAFVQEKLPNEHIDILVTQLQARFFANKKEHRDKRVALLKASRFGVVENRIKDIVINDGIAFRRKCFLSIIDTPLYSQSLDLLNCSSMAYKQYLMARERMNEFCAWQKEFIVDERDMLLKRIDKIFNGIAATIPYFVEENIERDDFSSLWKRHLKRQCMEQNVKKCFSSSAGKASSKVEQLFASLGEELNIKNKFGEDTPITSDGVSTTNWQRIWGWTSAVAGTVSAISVFASVPVLGWIAGGLTLLFGVFSWFSDSREDKLRKARIKQENNLKKALGRCQTQTKDNVFKAFQTQVVSGILTEAYNRFGIIQTTLLALANSQRELGLKYIKHHTDISRRIIESALSELGVGDDTFRHISFVARIPGKKTVIGCDECVLAKDMVFKIAKKLGNRELVYVFNRKLSDSLEENLKTLCTYFRLHVPMKIRSIEKNGFFQKVVFIPHTVELNHENNANLLLLQQILNVHIVKR